MMVSWQVSSIEKLFILALGCEGSREFRESRILEEVERS